MIYVILAKQTCRKLILPPHIVTCSQVFENNAYSINIDILLHPYLRLKCLPHYRLNRFQSSLEQLRYSFPAVGCHCLSLK